MRTLLKQRRLELGLSQRAIASHHSFPHTFVSKYETGERFLTFPEVVAMCRYLRLDIHDVVTKIESCRTTSREQERKVRSRTGTSRKTAGKPSLSTDILGIRFDNPFLLSSAPPTARVEGIEKAFAEGWGGAVLKTITPDTLFMRDISPRFTAARTHHVTTGFEHIELPDNKPVAYWKEGIRYLKRNHPRKVVVASIMAPVDRRSWQALIEELQETPVDAFELNFSCPHGMPEKGIGTAIGTDPLIASAITAWVKDVSRVPVFVKLTPNVTDIAGMARAVQHAGADGLAAINTVQCLMSVDLDTLEPQPSVNGLSTFGGYSGPAVKPVGLRCVAQAKAATGMPMFGMGGISSWRDSAEYISLGADAVEVCTAVMLYGYGIIKELTSGLTSYLESRGLASIGDIKGTALPKIKPHELLDRTHRKTARINASRCIECRRCSTVCGEFGNGAIRINGGRIEIHADACDGCSLCSHICPVQAIEMIS